MCKLPLESAPAQGPSGFQMHCRRCGTYRVTHGVARTPFDPGDQWPFLSAATRQAHERGQCLMLDQDGWRKLAEEHSNSSVEKMKDLVIHRIGSRTRPGGFETLDPEIDFPLFDMKSAGELSNVAKQLCDLGFLVTPEVQRAATFSLTAQGWNRFSEMSKIEPIETYKIWFKPVTKDKEPPTYQVYLSRLPQFSQLYAVTVVPLNRDSPVPKDESHFWNRTSQHAAEAVKLLVNEELQSLNNDQPMHISDERLIKRSVS